MFDRSNDAATAYWRANIRLVIKLLMVWFIVSYGRGLLLVDVLNEVQVGGTPWAIASLSRARSTSFCF